MKKIILIAIVCLGVFLRVYRLESVPMSPYWEEVALGYDAYSISQTGKDHHGNSYPVVAFPSFGDFKPSGYFYAIVPFIKIFGLSVLSVRLPSAIGGIVSVVLIYLIAKELFSKRIAVIATALFAIQPWAIQFSRGGWEVNLSYTLILSGVYFLLKSRKAPLYFFCGGFFLALSMYVYHAARLFSPLSGAVFGSFLLIESYRKLGWKKACVLALISLGIVLCLTLPIVSRIGQKDVSSRFWDTSILNQPESVLASNARISQFGSTRLSKIIFHRYWYYAGIIIPQWAAHFSPEFLFVRGDGNLRHSNGVFGLLYPMEAVLIGIALLGLRKKTKHRGAISALLVWIGLAAIPAALVTPVPHALRFLYASGAFAILSAVGIESMLTLKAAKIRILAIGITTILYCLCLTAFVWWYFSVYPVRSSNDWQYGYSQLYEKIAVLKTAHEQVYVSRFMGRPSMYYLFYSIYDPVILQKKEKDLPKDQLELLAVDDYHFIDSIPEDAKGIFALEAGTMIKKAQILDSVVSPSGRSIWTIWRKQ